MTRSARVRPIFDAFAIPVAVILGSGRIGNFIDGQIVGSRPRRTASPPFD